MQDELDILRETGSIAAAHGSIALSEILGRRIILNVPSTDIISCQDGSKRINLEKIGVAIFSKVLVGFEGEVAFLLDEKNAFKMISLSYKIREEEKKASIITETGLSFLKEIGNITISTYLNALSLVLKRVIIPSPPTLISGAIGGILSIILSPYGTDDYIYLIEAAFEEPRENIKGCFYLVLTPAAAKDIRETCKKMLKDMEK